MSDNNKFNIQSPFSHRGDQPNAIKKLARGVNDGLRFQTLLGVTGSGKTFTMAGIIEELQKPTLVIAHNKTLAAQLASELQEFFPNNSVQYFVSYYDYYQPEAYVPRTDTYIEKESDINDEIDRLRHASTRSILTRKDTIIVASVSCIYGLGSPEEYKSISQTIKIGDRINSSNLSRKLISMYFNRDDFQSNRGTFSIKGDTMEIIPSYEEFSIKIEFFGDLVDRITEVDILTKLVTKHSSMSLTLSSLVPTVLHLQPLPPRTTLRSSTTHLAVAQLRATMTSQAASSALPRWKHWAMALRLPSWRWHSASIVLP